MIRRLSAMLAACTGRPVGHIETWTPSHICRFSTALAACTGRPVGHIETQTASHCGMPLQTASWQRSSRARWVRLLY